jgi:hypothetical protein
VVTEHVSLVGTVKLPVKLALAPGPKDAALKMTVSAVGRSLTTTTLVSVMLPGFLTVPLYVSDPPGAGEVVGQVIVTAILGLPSSGQVLVALAVTRVPVHLSLPLAVRVEVTEQTPLLVGAVKLPVKLATPPGANVAAAKTGVLPVRSLTTTTLVKVTLPALLTVPL